MCIVIICYPVCGVINFEINISFLIKPFSYMTTHKNQHENLNISRTERASNMKLETNKTKIFGR